MNAQTRQLVGLLVDDTTPRILEALRGEPQTTPALAGATGASHSTVAQTLELLLAHGVVSWRLSRVAARGRPSRVWELTAGEQLDRFERACDEFMAALLRPRLAKLDQHATADKRPRHD